MRRSTGIILCYILLLLMALLPAQKIAAPSQVYPSPFSLSSKQKPLDPPQKPEVRALWVVRHTLTSPDSVINMVRRAKESGFTDLIVQVRGRGDAFYSSKIEPRAEDLAKQPSDFDPLGLVIREAHREGIKVHAWINIFLVANIESLPKSRDHLIYRHPEWLMVPKSIASELSAIDPNSPEYFNKLVEFVKNNREELEGLFASPAHPDVIENILSIWKDIAARYDVDGMHFDYVRYPNSQYDYSRKSLDRFKTELEKELDPENKEFLEARLNEDPLIYANTFPEKYAQFQRRQVSDLVGRIYKSVKKIRPQAIISAAVFANDEDAYRSRFQDWKLWLDRGWLDVVCPMAYTPDTEIFRKQISSAVGASMGKKVWSGIGAYRQPVESALEKIQIARELGAGGFILFSYDSSIKVSNLNPQGDYLEKMNGALKK